MIAGVSLAAWIKDRFGFIPEPIQQLGDEALSQSPNAIIQYFRRQRSGEFSVWELVESLTGMSREQFRSEWDRAADKALAMQNAVIEQLRSPDGYSKALTLHRELLIEKYGGLTDEQEGLFRQWAEWVSGLDKKYAEGYAAMMCINAYMVEKYLRRGRERCHQRLRDSAMDIEFIGRLVSGEEGPREDMLNTLTGVALWIPRKLRFSHPKK